MMDNTGALVVVLVGCGVVVLAWLVMRYAAKLFAALLIVAGVIAVLMLAAAPLANNVADVAESGADVAESAATFEQGVAIAEVAQVAQSGSNETVMLVGLFGCMGGGAILGIVALIGAGLFVWYKVRMGEQQVYLSQGQRRQALPDSVQAGQVIYIETDVDEGVDLAGVDLSQWGY